MTSGSQLDSSVHCQWENQHLCSSRTRLCGAMFHSRRRSPFPDLPCTNLLFSPGTIPLLSPSLHGFQQGFRCGFRLQKRNVTKSIRAIIPKGLWFPFPEQSQSNNYHAFSNQSTLFWRVDSLLEENNLSILQVLFLGTFQSFQQSFFEQFWIDLSGEDLTSIQINL